MDFFYKPKKVTQKLKESVNRFPFAVFFSTLTTVLLIYVINMEDYYQPETLEVFMKLAMAAALGFPLFLIIKAIFERLKYINKPYKTLIRIAAGLFLIGYYFLLLDKINMVSSTRYIAVSLSLYLLFLLIPYYYNRENFEIYVVEIFTRLFITFTYSLILFAGLSAILFTINELLNIPIPEIFYPSTGLAIGGLFAPIFLLANIPEQEEKFELKDFPKIFKILLTHIIMPLITAYTVILYIYFIKILITQRLPEGLVAHLVIWYASLSIIILFFISPLKKESDWVKLFRKCLPIALIPLLLMMFLAMYIRIKTYGVTENRYFVVILGLWVLGIAFYYIFTKKKNNVLLPLSLSILMVLSVFGPWSSYAVSIYSQNQRFESILNKYNMIQNNTIVKSQTPIIKEDQQQIQAIIKYFKNNHSLTDLKYLSDNFTFGKTEEVFGFAYQEDYRSQNTNYFSYNLNRSQHAISIKGYDYIFYISNQSKTAAIPQSNLVINFDYNNKEIIIRENDNEVYSKSLIPVVNALHQKNRDVSTKHLDINNFIYTDQNENYKFKFVFTSFSGNFAPDNSNQLTITRLDFFLIIQTL